MAGAIVVRKRKIESRPKVKTGCFTCRVRKVKCDEGKPFCHKCVSTGRTCDGYESPFRPYTSQLVKTSCIDSIKLSEEIQPARSTLIEVTSQEIDLLNRYFSTKTIFDVKLACDEEARQILQASLTNPPIQHAVSSLRALREDLEMSGDTLSLVTKQTPSYHYGLQQYSMALGGLASNLSSSDSSRLKSTLLCCQMFISIEQVRKDYAAMAQHIIRGLKIMHEYRARPGFVSANHLVPANHDQLPFLDTFIIKLFAAPCKFAEPPATADRSGTIPLVCPISFHQQSIPSRDLCTIAPDIRKTLTRIAASTLDFLKQVSSVASVENGLQLLSEKAVLLDSLESWFTNLNLVHTETKSLTSEPLSVSFLRLFHLILKIVLVGALDSSPDLYTKLRAENDRLQDVANGVAERVKNYNTCSGSGDAREKRSIAT